SACDSRRTSPMPAQAHRWQEPLPRTTHDKGEESIAVIGMACRFGGSATDLNSYWHLLKTGGSVVGDCPPGRWDSDHPYLQSEMFRESASGPCGAFLTDMERFDEAFFGLSAREAVHMDPQQRLLLE